MVDKGMPDILSKIVQVKSVEVERLKSDKPISDLQQVIEQRSKPLDFAKALRGDSVRIIAEVKKASPSKGLLREDFNPIELAGTYSENGAAAISVLTNVDHFRGSLQYLEDVQSVAYTRGVPVLRKEFIFDLYQVYEARAYGADALLLIVAILTPECLKELLDLSHRLGMQSLVEIHDEGELEVALEAGADIVGINNRDLRTFVTDLAVTERLAPQIPKDKTIVSESGINNREHINRIKSMGAHAALIGEALVTAQDVGAKLRELA